MHLMFRVWNAQVDISELAIQMIQTNLVVQIILLIQMVQTNQMFQAILVVTA